MSSKRRSLSALVKKFPAEAFQPCSGESKSDPRNPAAIVTDIALVVAVGHKHSLAIEKLRRRYLEPIAERLLKKFRDTSVSSQALVEVALARVEEKCEQYDGRGTIARWVRSIISNWLVDEWRQLNAGGPPDDIDIFRLPPEEIIPGPSQEDPATRLINKERLERFREFLRLQEPMDQVILKMKGEGFAPKVIASVLHVDEGTISRRLKRLRRRWDLFDN